MCIANYYIINHRIYTATRLCSVIFTYMCVFMYLSMYLYIYLCNLCPPLDCGWYVSAVTDTQHFVRGLPTQRYHHSHESTSRYSFKCEWPLMCFTLKSEIDIDKNYLCSALYVSELSSNSYLSRLPMHISGCQLNHNDLLGFNRQLRGQSLNTSPL